MPGESGTGNTSNGCNANPGAGVDTRPDHVFNGVMSETQTNLIETTNLHRSGMADWDVREYRADGQTYFVAASISRPFISPGYDTFGEAVQFAADSDCYSR